jgi:outer membrane murein-binding lipoprotein Lpp
MTSSTAAGSAHAPAIVTGPPNTDPDRQARMEREQAADDVRRLEAKVARLNDNPALRRFVGDAEQALAEARARVAGGTD